MSQRGRRRHTSEWGGPWAQLIVIPHGLQNLLWTTHLFSRHNERPKCHSGAGVGTFLSGESMGSGTLTGVGVCELIFFITLPKRSRTAWLCWKTKQGTRNFGYGKFEKTVELTAVQLHPEQFIHIITILLRRKKVLFWSYFVKFECKQMKRGYLKTFNVTLAFGQIQGKKVYWMAENVFHFPTGKMVLRQFWDLFDRQGLLLLPRRICQIVNRKILHSM